MTQKPIDILYFVEHVARELDVACVFSVLFEKHYPQIKVKIASAMFSMADTVQSYQPKLVITPYCYGQDSYIFKYLLPAYGDSVRYVNLAYEQIVADTQIHRKMPKDDFAKQKVTHVVWSEHFAKHLKDAGVETSQIRVHGNPNFSLYARPFSQQALSKPALGDQFGLDEAKPWLFIPGNFGPAFWSGDKQRRKLAEGCSESYISAHIEQSRQTFRTILNWIEQSQAANIFEIILRPKPSVGLETYRTFVHNNTKSERLHIIKDYAIRDWILASDLVASNFSTSLIDAAISGKPTALLEPIKLEGERYSQWHDQAQRVSSLAAFQNYLRSANNQGSDALKDWAQDYLNPQAIEHLVHLCHDKLASPLQTNDISRYDKTIPKNPNLVSNIDDFSEQDVQERLEAWRQVLVH